MASKPQDGMILPNQGPWGHRGGGGGGNDDNQGGGGDNKGGGNWSQRPSGGRGNEPDLDDMLRQAQDKFKNTFGGRRPTSDLDPGKAVLLLIFLVFMIWMGTGFYTVQPQENALILTFGKVTDTKTEAGLGYHFPSPIQDDIKVPVSVNNQLDIGFSSAGGARSDNPRESMMLTGDANIVNIHFSVRWHIGDAKQYTFDIEGADGTVKKVAESAMREIIGRTEIQKAMTEGRQDIETNAKKLTQDVLDEYKSGVIINSIQLLSVDPPAPVVDAFNDVQRARTDKETAKNEAEKYQNDIVPRAKGDAQKIIQDAGAYKSAVMAKAQGDAERFNSVYTAYAVSKDVTQKRIYLETMQDVLKNSKKIIVGDDKGVMPWLSLDGKSASRLPQQPSAQ
ncbi:MAG: FtsH protease activity modulator HflK [Alphaproteobacteria bacterium]